MTFSLISNSFSFCPGVMQELVFGVTSQFKATNLVARIILFLSSLLCSQNDPHKTGFLGQLHKKKVRFPPQKNGNSFNGVLENLTISTFFFLSSYPLPHNLLCDILLYLVICKAPILF